MLFSSLPVWFPLYILASVCKSLYCLISALTQGGSGGHFLRLTCSVVLWGGRDAAKKKQWRVLAVSRPHWVCRRSRCLRFPCLQCLGSRLLCQGVSEAGPGLYALPRSKPLRFRYSGSPQRCRLSWACVLCSPRVRAAQVTRCLPNVVAATYCLPRPCWSVFWVYNQRTFSGVPCVSSGALTSGCDPPGGCRLSRIPRSLG